MTEGQHKEPMGDLEFIEHSLSCVVQRDMDYAVAPSAYKVDMANQIRRVLKELYSGGMKASEAKTFLKDWRTPLDEVLRHVAEPVYRTVPRTDHNVDAA